MSTQQPSQLGNNNKVLKTNGSVLSYTAMEEAVINNFMLPSLWLDYTDKPTLVKSGNSVTSWLDKSNNNLVATATGTAPIDDGTGIKFGGASNTNLVVPNLFNTGHENFTMFVVRKPNSDFPTPNIDVQYSSGAYYACVFNNYEAIETYSNNTTDAITGVNKYMGNFGKGSSYPNQALIETTRFGFGQRTLGVDYRIFTRPETGNVGITGNFTLGTYTPSGFIARQTITEVLVFPRYLTDQEVAFVARYLDKKYNTASNGERKHFQNAQIHFAGDSLTLGFGTGVGQARELNYPNQAMAQVGSGFYYTIANSGLQVADLTTIINTHTVPRFSNTYHRNVIVLWVGTNDLRLTATSGNDVGIAVGNLALSLRNQGWRVAVVSCLPRKDAGVPVDFETRRTALNNYLASNWTTFANAFVDLRTDTAIDNANAPDDATYYDPDKVHMRQAGYKRVADLVAPAITSLLA